MTQVASAGVPVAHRLFFLLPRLEILDAETTLVRAWFVNRSINATTVESTRVTEVSKIAVQLLDGKTKARSAILALSAHGGTGARPLALRSRQLRSAAAVAGLQRRFTVGRRVVHFACRA